MLSLIRVRNGAHHWAGTASMIAMLAALSGCANLGAPAIPPAPLPSPENSAAALLSEHHTELQGQLSIKLEAFGEQAASGISVGFFFTGNDTGGRLDIMTLMGSQVAQVTWTPRQAWLVNDKGRTPYESLEQLSLDTLGEALPLRALIHWMAGKPDPSLPSQSQSEAGRFIQVGWLIDTTDLNQKRLQANRPATLGQRGVRIKVYLDR